MLRSGCVFKQNDEITSGKVCFKIADPLLFCHPVRDRLTLNGLDHLEAEVLN
jgi:hypothetical protein